MRDVVIVEKPIREIIRVEGSTNLPASSGDMVIGEIPSGLLNGSNATFTTLNQFKPGTVRVYLNGVRQTIVDDYQTIGNQTITLVFSPFAGEHLLVDYEVL